MKKTDRRGLISTETLLVLIILALVGFIGWYVYRSKNATNQTLQGIGQTSSTTVQKSAATSAVAKIAILGYSMQASSDGGVIVPVNLKNNDMVSHSVTVRVTFTNLAGQTLESDTGMLNDLAAGQTQSLTVIGSKKVASFNNLKVEIQKVN